MTAGIASFRMYNATPAVAAAWQALFARVFAELGWPVQVIPHAWPAPLTALWQRRDLVCGFMCGLPFVRGAAPVVPLVAPVPRGAHEGANEGANGGAAGDVDRSGAPARYRSEFLVRAECGWRTLADTFGHRFGWMAEHSQSGYHAARRALAAHATAGQSLFAASIGPLDTPARTLAALRTRQIDVTALDGFYLDLLRHHAPDELAELQSIAVTPWTPNPLLVASDTMPEPARRALADKLAGLDASYRALLDAVLVERFVVPDVAAYRVLLEPVSAYPEIH